MPTQTPVSRKFAPPSNTSSGRPFTRPASTNRFVRPSQTSSSPFPRTPFSGTVKNVGYDEIEAEEVEEDEDDLIEPFLGSTSNKSPRQQQESSDMIVAGSETLPGSYAQPHQKSTSWQTAHTQIYHNSEYASSTTKRRKVSHFTSEPIINDDTDLPSPLPSDSSAKQQPADSEADTHVQIPRSSPDNPPEAPIDYQHQHNYDNDASSDLDSDNHSPIVHHLATPKHTRTSKSSFRFRTPHPTSTALTQTDPHPIFPSFQSRLLASTSTPSTSSPGPHIRGPHPEIDFTLPDVFSPSRKRGNREYLYGGHAEAVRGWVLDIAARTSGSTSSFERDNKLLVQDVLLRDPAERFIVISCHSGPQADSNDQDRDHDANIWLLTNTEQQTRSRAAASSKLDAIQPGSLITIKGGGGEAATWQMELDTSLPVPRLSNQIGITATATANALSTQTGELENNAPTAGTMKCMVAVLWDIVR